MVFLHKPEVSDSLTINKSEKIEKLLWNQKNQFKYLLETSCTQNCVCSSTSNIFKAYECIIFFIIYVISFGNHVKKPKTKLICRNNSQNRLRSFIGFWIFALNPVECELLCVCQKFWSQIKFHWNICALLLLKWIKTGSNANFSSIRC